WVTDRPDKTEAAYTVDAGHFVHETDLFNYTYDSEGGDRVESFFALAPNLKAGLTDRIDLQLVVSPINHISEHSRRTSSSSRENGFGDLLVRTKFNLWGNDGGSTAGGIMPFISFPTGHKGISSDHTEGGVILPLQLKLGDGFDIGMMH